MTLAHHLRAALAASFAAGGSASALVLGAGLAFAQVGDPAAAEALFDRGKALQAAGSWDEACEKFRASLDLDPTASAQVKVARCLERRGALASAWIAYVEARKLNRATAVARHRDEIEQVIAAELVAIEPRVPHLRLRMDPIPTGLQIARDGVTVPLAAMGEPLPVDPGIVDLVATAPGHVPLELQLTVAEGETREVLLTLAAAPQVVEAAGDLARRPDARPASAAEIPPSPPGDSAWSTLGFVSLGAGAATGAVAIGFGIATANLVSDSDAECDADDVCSEAGVALREDARSLQTAGLGLAVASGALLGLGITAIVLGGSVGGPDDVAVLVSPGSLHVRGVIP